MSDIRKLIEAVEGGAEAHVVQIFAKRLSSAAIDRGDYWPSHDVEKAFRGSLDAAKALHKTLLPGWTRDVDATAPECGITVTLHRVTSFSDSEVISADMPCEARAWLLSILKAYEAQQ